MKKTLFAIAILFFASCTEQEMAKEYGGTVDFKLAPSEKVITATWKGVDLWVLVEDTVAHKTYLREQSNYGILEGRINFTK